MTTNVIEAHRHALEALTSGQYNNFALFSCAVDGAPAAAIVAVNERPPAHDGAEPGYTLHPLFVSVTPTMILTDHDGVEAWPSG